MLNKKSKYLISQILKIEFEEHFKSNKKIKTNMAAENIILAIISFVSTTILLSILLSSNNDISKDIVFLIFPFSLILIAFCYPLFIFINTHVINPLLFKNKILTAILFNNDEEIFEVYKRDELYTEYFHEDGFYSNNYYTIISNTKISERSISFLRKTLGYEETNLNLFKNENSNDISVDQVIKSIRLNY